MSDMINSTEKDPEEVSGNNLGSYDDYLFETALQELNELITRIPVKNKDVNYLLNFWQHFSIYQIDPSSFEKTSVEHKEEDEEGGGGDETIPCVTRIKGGWKVLDYGDGLITSSGENYGSYSTGALLKTVKYMVDCLAKRGAKTVIFSGALPAKRLAWMECMRHGIKNKFSPNKQDAKCQESLSKILEGKFVSFKL